MQVLFKYCTDTQAVEATPRIGNRATGSRAVTARGISSSIQQKAIRSPTQAHFPIFSSAPVGMKTNGERATGNTNTHTQVRGDFFNLRLNTINICFLQYQNRWCGNLFTPLSLSTLHFYICTSFDQMLYIVCTANYHTSLLYVAELHWKRVTLYPSTFQLMSVATRVWESAVFQSGFLLTLRNY